MTDVDKSYRKIIYLTFPQEVSGRPMVCNLTRLFDLTFNILKAQIPPRREGNMTLELSGTEENYKKGVSYLKDHGIKVASAAQRISRDEESCTHCGTCTAICPNDSLYLDRTTMRVVFDKERCAACGLCTRVCPVRAMHVEVENGNEW
jgi:ferredoxin